MRRIIHIALSLCLLCSLLSVSAHAADSTTYHLEEAGLSVTVPDSLAAFSRDYSPDDPELSTFGLSEEILQSVFYDGNNYLIALDRRLAHEVLVSMVDNGADQTTFETLSDPMPADEIDPIVEEYEAMGFQFLEEPRVHQHDQINFLVLNCKYYAEEIPLHCLMYITAYNNKSIGLTMRSYLGLVTEEQEALMQAMVDSVVFDVPEDSTAPSAPEEPAEAPGAVDLLGHILLVMLITVVVYALPIIIYRYAARKRPVPRKKAKWITVIYAFVFFFLSSILLFTSTDSGYSGLAIILWSFINYRMLVSGGTDGSPSDTNTLEH